jgi:hypothetical protein
LAWKEAHVSRVRRAETVSPVDAVTLGSPEEVGRQLGQRAGWSGLKPGCRVRGLGDRTPWIAEQMEIQLGAQGSHPIDFYHRYNYLATAAPRCLPQTPQVGLEKQKTRFKTGQQTDVLATLKPPIESEG